ncbi:MAG: HAD family hydrolase [Pyrinomonadaceae bacterium]
MIKAILFDFNGVIIDDEMLQMKAYQEVFAPYGVALSETQYFQALGMDDSTFVRTAFANAGKELTEETMQGIAAAKQGVHRRLLTDDLPLFPGVKTLLKATTHEFDLGLVSMANREEIAYIFERAGIGPLFSIVVSAEDVNVCKPAPDCYQKGLEKLNERRRTAGKQILSASECLAVEDSPPGIEAGRAAGMRTLGVLNTVSEAELRAAGAEVVTKDLADWTVEAIRLVFE